MVIDAGTRAKRLRIALAINVVIVVAQVIVGFSAHSIGLLSDAAHNLTDIVALALAFIAVQLTRRPATSRRSFGWHRGTILAAQANAAMILALTVWILYEGISRWLDPPTVQGRPVVLVALLAFVANTSAALVVREQHSHAHGPTHAPTPGASTIEHDTSPHRPRRDLNMHAAMLHLVSDALASLGVAITGAVIWITGGWNWLDPAVSVVIGLSIGWHAWRLLRSSNAVLLEAAPEGLDPLELHGAMLEIAGVDAVHDLHVWSIASNLTALSAHVVVPDGVSLAQAQSVASAVRTMLERRYGIDHSTLELEEVACAENGAPCDLGDVRDPLGHHHHPAGEH
jgi:cobalt-zinc-cadmium efflux system protein